ncbi:MAG: phosphohydrolase, partial [Acidobacteriota bacterium]|nr:phosphohydrolase [Acidobacteriota bacterium]
SAGIEPRSLEGRILQDADRLDAIGFTGIARCFYTAGRMNSQLYHPEDPRGSSRELNDSLFALDHFPKKLLLLAEGFRTKTGRRLARIRHEELLRFYGGMLAEIGPEG